MSTDSSARTYWVTAAVLLVLLVLSIVTALIDLGKAATVVALVIAAIKVSLVAALFMHLTLSSRLTRLFAVTGLFWFAILIALTLSDYLTRDPGWWRP